MKFCSLFMESGDAVVKSVCTTVVRGEEVEELHPAAPLPSSTQPWWTRRCGCSEERSTHRRGRHPERVWGRLSREVVVLTAVE